MENEQLEFDFVIKDNQNFEGVSMNPHDFTVITTNNTSGVGIGSSVIGGGGGGNGGVGALTGFGPATMYDQNHRNKEIILLLQVQFPETYKQIMDALKARDALVDSQW